jgi:hypothetical protein
MVVFSGSCACISGNVGVVGVGIGVCIGKYVTVARISSGSKVDVCGKKVGSGDGSGVEVDKDVEVEVFLLLGGEIILLLMLYFEMRL